MERRLLFVSRQSPDWHSLSHDYQRGVAIDPSRFRPPEPIPGFPDNIVDLIDAWNRQMGVDFFTCRSVLKDMSKVSVRNISNKDVTDHESLAALGDDLRRYLVIYHDDDDWFSPEIVNLEGKIADRKWDVCVFPLIRLSTDTFTFVKRWKGAKLILGRRKAFDFRYQSNNYALNADNLSLENISMMKDHVLASAHASAKSLKDLYIDEIYGLTTKTPCSASMLAHVVADPARGRNLVKRYVEALERLTIPAGLEWVSAPIGGLIDLFARV